jgi:hypothetical protein
MANHQTDQWLGCQDPLIINQKIAIDPAFSAARNAFAPTPPTAIEGTGGPGGIRTNS